MSDSVDHHTTAFERVGRHAPGHAGCAVRQRGRNDEQALGSLLHAHHTLVPALDHGSLANLEAERLFLRQIVVEFLPC